MNSKRAKLSELLAVLTDSGQRAIAKIAVRANNNTVLGGFSAAIIAKRMQSMGLPSANDCMDAVSLTYSQSSGNVPDQYAAYQCGECGQVHLGIEPANMCCGDCL